MEGGTSDHKFSGSLCTVCALDLQVVMNLCVGAGNRTRVPCKGSKRTYSLSRFSSLFKQKS